MPAQKTSDETVKHDKDLIRKVVGLQSEEGISFNDSGWDSRVYSFKNERYFFKFPRTEKIKGRYKYEIAALKLAAGVNSNMGVPKVTWEHPNNDYFGYEGLPGIALTEKLPGLDEKEKQVIGATIGSFLRQFHHLKLPGARDMSVPEEMKQLQFWYNKGLPITRKVFSKGEQQKLHKLVYEDCPKRLSELGSDGSLCHGDLGFWNMIYQDKNQIGLIDFGDICNCDSSKDFIGLDDNSVLEAALQAYGDSDMLRQKIDARKVIPAVISLRFYWEKKDQAGIDKTVPKIKAILTQTAQL